MCMHARIALSDDPAQYISRTLVERVTRLLAVRRPGIWDDQPGCPEALVKPSALCHDHSRPRLL